MTRPYTIREGSPVLSVRGAILGYFTKSLSLHAPQYRVAIIDLDVGLRLYNDDVPQEPINDTATTLLFVYSTSLSGWTVYDDDFAALEECMRSDDPFVRR